MTLLKQFTKDDPGSTGF